MFLERKEIPTCQIEDGLDYNGNEKCCGDPSVAIWNWGTGDLYVCEKHDIKIQETEENKEVEK